MSRKSVCQRQFGKPDTTYLAIELACPRISSSIQRGDGTVIHFRRLWRFVFRGFADFSHYALLTTSLFSCRRFDLVTNSFLIRDHMTRKVPCEGFYISTRKYETDTRS
jgi:hypothetical protein